MITSILDTNTNTVIGEIEETTDAGDVFHTGRLANGQIVALYWANPRAVERRIRELDLADRFMQ